MATAIDPKYRLRRRPTDYRRKAAELGVAIDGLDDDAIRRAVGAEEGRRFYEEYRASVDYWNRWVAENGLPLEKYRQF